MLTHGSLFAGIGGFDLGFERAGIKTVWQVEIEEYCRRVLARHFPHARRYEDVRDCGKSNLQWVDILSGGFPCQDISNAGKRAGIDGERSGLWSEYARIIRELRPRYVVVENVAALLGRGMERVLGDLAACGYDAEWQSIRASDVGAPHRRERVCLVAYPQRSRRRESASYLSVIQESLCAPKRKKGASVARPGSEDAANPNGSGHVHGQAQIFTAERGLDALGEFVASGPDVAHADSQRQQDVAGWWDIEPDVGRVVDGLSLELDCFRRLNETGDSTEAKSEAQRLSWRVVQFVWVNQELAKASPGIYRERLCGLVPGMSHEAALSRWLLGARLEEKEELRDLWSRVYASPLGKAFDLLPELFERVGQAKCPEALARVNRLRGLGNAIIPQIAEWIGRRIVEAVGAKG